MFSTVKNACCSPTGPWIHRLRSRIQRNAKPKYPSESSNRLELDFWRWSYEVLLILLEDIDAAIKETPSRCTCTRPGEYICVDLEISTALDRARLALVAISRFIDDYASVVVSRMVKKPIGDVNLILRTLSILMNNTRSLHERLVSISKVDNFFLIPPKRITFHLDTTKEVLQCLSAMQFKDNRLSADLLRILYGSFAQNGLKKVPIRRLLSSSYVFRCLSTVLDSSTSESVTTTQQPNIADERASTSQNVNVTGLPESVTTPRQPSITDERGSTSKNVIVTSLPDLRDCINLPDS